MPLQIPVIQTGLEASIQQAMKNAGRSAQINIGTNSRQINALSQPLGRITGQADEFTKSMEAANARVFAFGASVGIINGVTRAFSSLVKNTIQVEKSLVEINTVLNASGDSLQKFGNKLFDVAKTTGQTFDVVAKGALELARQGLSTEETLKRINDALILSRLSGLDAQQSVEGLTAAFNSFKDTGITTSEILNKLVVVSQKYSVSEKDLIEGLKRSASVADQAGVSFDELVGIITTVQERTARGGAVIGNAFKTIFARIQDTGALQDLSNLGIQVTDLEGRILPATKILQNLGAEFNNLSQLEQADIAKKLGGVYQLSNLLAAVKDLSSEQSKYNDIVKLSAGASNEAYKKNAALNETLAALINKVTLSSQQLGATLGAIGITDNLKSLLDFFNKILEGIQGILGEESMLGDMFRGLAKGIGSVLAGPGLALFGAIIAKLSKDLISFGLESLKSFFKIGQAAKDIASVEKSIATALGSNLTLQKQIFALEGNRAAQIKLMTDAIVQQEAAMRRMTATAGSLGAPLYQKGVRAAGGEGLRVPKAAGGYMPAVSQESRDISRGVGGAKSGDKPVVIPNFAFGGGKRGSMVAHTGEFIVPNFASGGSAIFNRDMVRSMGLPSGAQKIGAAGGFIPNFANIATETSRTNLNSIIANKSGRKSPQEVATAKKRLAELEDSKLPLNQLTKINPNGSDFGMIVGQKGVSNQISRFADEAGRISSTQTQGSRYLIDVPIYRVQDQNLKFKETKTLNEQISKYAAATALKMAKGLSGNQLPSPENIEEIRKSLNPGTLAGTTGTIFEAGISGILKDDDFKDYAKINRNSLIDFKPYGKIRELFGIPGSSAKIGLEAKATDATDLVSSAAGKFLKNAKGLAAFSSKKASKGYVPNFANPLKEAINREMSAGVPASQIYIDKNSSLKNSMNPMGLMIANRRDEPAGGMQGINRARKEGANPMTYGAAGGFVPNYAATRDPATGRFVKASDASTTSSSGDIEPVKRDLLGIIFAVQTGLSLFNGATAGATSGLGKLANAIGSVASTASTVALVGQGLSGLAKEGSTASTVLGKIGIYGAIAAGVFEAFKQVGIYLDSTNSSINQASQAMYRVSEAASKAAINLSNLNPAQKEKIQQSREGLISGATTIKGTNKRNANKEYIARARFEGVSDKLKESFDQTIDQALAVGVSYTTMWNMIQEASKSGGKITADEVGKISQEIERLIETAAKVKPEDLIKKFNLKPEEGLGATLAGLNAKDKQSFISGVSGGKGGAENAKTSELLKLRQQLLDQMSAEGLTGKTPQEESLKLIIDLLNEKADVQKEALDNERTGSSKQIEQTIRNIQIESSLRKKLFQETNKANNAQISADLDIANLKSDITLSELERNKLVGRRQFQLEKDLAVLENQKSSMTEIAALAKTISESSFVSQNKKVGAALQAESAIKALSGQDINEFTDVAKMLEGMEINFGLIKSESVLKNVLDAALKIKDAAAKTTEEFNQQNNFKERGLSLAEAEARVNENNSRVFEKMQSSMSAMADDRSILARRLGYLSQSIEAEKDVKLAKLEVSNPSMPPSQRIEQQRAIEKEAFNRQLEINTRKSIVEAEADFIRNSKVEENVIALQNNNTALEKNTDALLKIAPTAGEFKGFNIKDFVAAGGIKAKSNRITTNTFNQNDLKGFVENGADVSKLTAGFADSLQKFAADYFEKFGEELKISGSKSAFRTPEESVNIRNELIKNKGLEYALKYSATPGKSQHNFGNAIDIDQSQMQQAVNSGMDLGKYGLTRPMSYEPWHVEPIGARGGMGGVTNTTQTGYSYAPADTKMVSVEDQIKKARELSSLGTAKEIQAAAQNYTAELKLQENVAGNVAERIKDLALKIKEAGGEKAFQEKMEKIRKDAEAARDAIKSIAELEKIDLEKQLAGLKESPVTFKEGMENGFLALQVKQAQFGYNLGKEIPEMFSKGMSDAIMSAVDGTTSLKEGLRSAAYEFVKTINQRMMGNLADKFTSSIGNLATSFFSGSGGGNVTTAASGGMINGGSGNKDDIPAMLMGGEYVVKKTAVQKYGEDFLHAINNGSLGGYAKGGSVNKDYFTPGSQGVTSIVGKEDLLGFATQSYTSGDTDVIKAGKNFASVNLEAESLRLTQFGRQNNPMFQAIQADKKTSFDMYATQIKEEEDYKLAVEAFEKEQKEKKKALRKQLIMMVAMAAVSAGVGAVAGSAGAGFKAGFGASKAANGGTFTNIGAGLKGIFTGGQLPGMTQNVGGLNNLFSGLGKGLTGNFAEAGNLFKLSQIGDTSALGKAYAQSIGTKGDTFAGFSENIGFIPKAVNPYNVSTNAGLNGGNSFDWFNKLRSSMPNFNRNDDSNNKNKYLNRATGGAIPSTTGVDTVPAMLSGGEFIMNRAASQNIGAGNLQSLNSGASSLPTEEKTEELNNKLIAKLDELIEKGGGGTAGNITINVDGKGQSSETKEGESNSQSGQLARTIRDVVLKVIQDEKRLGGVLRK